MQDTNLTVEQAAAALRTASTAELDVTVDARPNPAWVWPSFGVAAGLFLASFDVVGNSPWVALTSIAYAIVIGLIVGQLQRSRGVQPRLSRLPRALRRQVLQFVLVGWVLGAAAVGATLLLLDGPPRFTIAGLVVGTLLVVGGRRADARWLEAARAIRAERAA